MSDKCNCHHWVCGCNFTVGHTLECDAKDPAPPTGFEPRENAW